MNYQDMLKLKTGDEIKVLMEGVWVEGTVSGTQGGAEPSIWLEYTKGCSLRIYTGSNFIEQLWYQSKRHTLIRWQDEWQERLSMEIMNAGGRPHGRTIARELG